MNIWYELIVTPVQAAEATIELNVPLGTYTHVESFVGYFQTWYSIIVGVGAVLAVIMIMWGGIKWLTSRGNSGTITEAKNIIWGAVTGLTLALLSYTILFYVNPNLVQIGLPTLTGLGDSSGSGAGQIELQSTAQGECPRQLNESDHDWWIRCQSNRPAGCCLYRYSDSTQQCSSATQSADCLPVDGAQIDFYGDQHCYLGQQCITDPSQPPT